MPDALPLDDRLEIAAQLAGRSRIFFDIWWFYESADTRPMIIDAMDVYSEFFRFDSHAHFVSLVIHLAALFEKKHNTINIARLIMDAKNEDVSLEVLEKVNRLMAEISDLPSKVHIIRNNLFAHRNDYLSYDECFRKAALKPKHLRELTEVALLIANTLLIARGRKEQFFHELSRWDVERMLNDLSKANAIPYAG